jgi:hypothetical protein
MLYVITDGKTVASWAVHHSSPNRTNREIREKRRSAPIALLYGTSIKHVSYGRGLENVGPPMQRESTLARPGNPSHTS